MSLRNARWWARSVGLPTSLAVIGAASLSRAQHVDPSGALTVIVGPSSGNAVMDRLDVHRTNTSASRLPAGLLRIIWTRHLTAMRQAPLVMRDGTVFVVGINGDAHFLNADGTDQSHLTLGPGSTSAPALLADGTLVVINATGDVLGARRGAISFRTHLVDAGNQTSDTDDIPQVVHRVSMNGVFVHGVGPQSHFLHPQVVARDSSPENRTWLLPIEDGGFVAAIDRELVCLDARGSVRSRAKAPVVVTASLLATAHAVAFVTENGEAYTWDLTGASDSVRARGSFGGALDGAVAAEDDRHLLAVVDGSRLVSLDLVTGEASTRAHVTSGTFTGAFALDPASGTAWLEEIATLGARVLAVDRAGQETPFPVLLARQSAQALPDAGALGFLAPSHTMLFADPTGAVAYGTVDGHVGVASMSSKVEVGALPCGTPPSASGVAPVQAGRPSAGFAGLVPAGPSAFVVACENGTVALIRGVREDGEP